MDAARNQNLSRETKLCQDTLFSVAKIPGVSVPAYNRSLVEVGWAHIGCGAFHRAHQAAALDTLLSSDFNRHRTWGLCGVNVMPQTAPLCDRLASQNGLYTLLERDRSGEQLRVIGSVAQVLCASRELPTTISRLVSPAVKLITLTVTEGGYYFDLSAKRLLAEHADIQSDLRGTTPPRTALGLLARVLDERRARGIELPTLLSCDNVSGNGHVLRAALLEFCQMSNPELATYIEEHTSFPNSMVDRITPRTTDADREHIRNTYWIDDQAPVVCERFFQWVIEDRFPLGRPAFENVPGVIFTSDVRPYEEMKLGLLNAGHSQLGYLGHLAGYTSIDQVAAEPTFGQLLMNFWHGEVIPHLAPVPGVSFDDYCATLTERFCNPCLGDQTLRICLDGSSKIPTFILPSVRAGLAHGTSIQLGALCVAAWIRFCSGTGERGEAIPLEDPMATTLRELAVKVKNSPIHDARGFIRALPEVFGELSSSQAFIQAVSSWVHSLYEHGAARTLEIALERSGNRL